MIWLCSAILIGTFAEGLALTWWRRQRGTGPRPSRLWPNLAAGAALVLALLLALSGAPSLWLLIALAAALVAHVADLRMRWQD